MGNESSTLTPQDFILVPQLPDVAAIDAKFCAKTTVRLDMKTHVNSAWNNGKFDVRNVLTNETMFQLKGNPLSIRDRKTLLDYQGVAIANTENSVFSRDIKCRVYPGTSVYDELFTIFAACHTFSGTELEFNFVNRVDKQPCRMGVAGDWRGKHAVLWLDVGRRGRRTVVGRVSLPPTETTIFDRYHYHLEIAPGMDMAIMVLLCVALDEAVHEHRDRMF